MPRLLLPAVLALLPALAATALADGARGHALGADMARLPASRPPAPEAPGAGSEVAAECVAGADACPAPSVPAGE